MRAGQTSLGICRYSCGSGAEQGTVRPYTDGHPLAMTELLSRHSELCNFPVFRLPFYSCSVCASCSILFLECICQTAPGALNCAVQELGCPRLLQTFGVFI